MFATRFRIMFAALAILASQAATGMGQNSFAQQRFVESDFQLFEPVDLELDGFPVRKDNGFFFNYDKVYWAFTGERITIGERGLTYPSEQMFRDSVDSLILNDRNAPQTYDIENDIKNAPPNAEFGWGERYEFGYVDDDGHGIHIGILDGPNSNSQTTYGFGTAGITGFGSVHVNFDIPNADFLAGFRDYGSETVLSTDADDTDSPIEIVLGGPGVDVGDDEVDNLDGDRVGGVFFVLGDLNLDGVIDDDEVIGFGYDFDDLHVFNIRFDTLTVRNSVESKGIELMRTHQLDNRHYMKQNQNQRLEIGYGVRFFRLDDRFFYGGNIDGVNGWGNTFSDTEVSNQLVGPQIRLKWKVQKSKWQLALDSRFMFGYNIQDLDQTNGFGSNLVTGGFNQPATAQSTFSANGMQHEEFSPMVELRAEASYSLTQAISLKLGYNAMFLDNISRGSQVAAFSLPNFGLQNPGEQSVFINGVNLGVEIRH